jgi:hypothetical protein
VKNCVVKDAIDGDGCTYSERERQDGGKGESQVAKDLTKGKAEILQQYWHRSLQGKGKPCGRWSLRAWLPRCDPQEALGMNPSIYDEQQIRMFKPHPKDARDAPNT